jgi:hypothetical protein
VLQLNAIAHGYEMPGSADIRKFENVRVAPGHYLLVVICRSSTAVGRFDLKVDAVAGGEYLVECSGAGIPRARICGARTSRRSKRRSPRRCLRRLRRRRRRRSSELPLR